MKLYTAKFEWSGTRFGESDGVGDDEKQSDGTESESKSRGLNGSGWVSDPGKKRR